MGISSVIDLTANIGVPATNMIVTATCFFEILVLVGCSWFVLQRTLGNEGAFQTFKIPFSHRYMFSMVIIAVIAITAGGLAAYSGISWLGWLILPVATLFVIVPPIFLVIGIGSKGLNPGPRWRFAAILGMGMTAGPLIIIGLEIAILAVGIVLWGFYAAAFSPDLLNRLENLAAMIDMATSEEAIINLLSPYLTNPYLIVAVLGYISVLVPLVEETFKPLAVWIFASRIETPAQGFVLGMVSGGAFALIESLNASADGTTNWPFVVGVRAGTSLLHMAVSGMVGWGITSAIREKKYGRFAGAYLSAILIHGLWNACAVGAGLSFVGEFVGRDDWLIKYLPGMLGGMITLAVGMLVTLAKINRDLKAAQSAVEDEQQVQLPA